MTMSSGNPFIPNVFYGIVAAGGVFSGINTTARVPEVVQQLKAAKPKLFICSPDCRAQALAGAQQYGLPEDRVLILDCQRPKEWRLDVASTGSDTLELGAGKQLDWTRITDLQQLRDTTICLLYSSGTTGLPKGVRISHWALAASAICTMDVAVRYRERKRKQGKDFRFNTICHLPMANIAGIALYCCNPLYMGGSTYWMEKYDFDSLIAYHRKYRPDYQFSVPPVWLRIAKSDKITDHFDGLQIACTGSAPIGYATMKELQSKLKPEAEITQTWGTTETCGVITALDWHVDNPTWSVGRLCPNVTLRVLDENDQDVEPGQQGELLIGGPIVAQCYYNNLEITRETFVDGFYRSGDIGLCKDGLVYITDRKKELIKYKGSQVAPAELEALLVSHSLIADAAVIGVWDASQETELPRAYVVRKDASRKIPLTDTEIANFVKHNLADYKRLRGGVFFIDEIPKSMSGKILRKELRAAANQPPKSKL